MKIDKDEQEKEEDREEQIEEWKAGYKVVGQIVEYGMDSKMRMKQNKTWR